MSLAFTEEQKLLQKTVREFAENEVKPRLGEILTCETYIPRDIYKRMGELDLLRALVSKENGGLGLGAYEGVIITEELSKVCPALGLIYMCSGVTLPAMDTCRPFVEKYLDKCLSGDYVFGGFGTDPAGNTNHVEWPVLAVRDGNEWVLNGTRLFGTNAHAVDIAQVYGFTDDGQFKIFLIEGNTPGFNHDAPEIKFGMKGSGGGTTVYKDVRLPLDLAVDVNTESGLFYSTVITVCAAIALGTMEGALKQATEYTLNRSYHFEPLSSMQNVAELLAKLKAYVEVSRSALYDAASALDDPDRLEEGLMKARCVKYFIPETAFQVTKETVKLHGGLGYSDVNIFHWFADAVATQIMDATSEKHLEALAEMMGIKITHPDRPLKQ